MERHCFPPDCGGRPSTRREDCFRELPQVADGVGINTIIHQYCNESTPTNKKMHVDNKKCVSRVPQRRTDLGTSCQIFHRGEESLKVEIDPDDPVLAAHLDPVTVATLCMRIHCVGGRVG